MVINLLHEHLFPYPLVHDKEQQFQGALFFALPIQKPGDADDDVAYHVERLDFPGKGQGLAVPP